MRGVDSEWDRSADDAGRYVGDVDSRRAVRLHQERTAFHVATHCSSPHLHTQLYITSHMLLDT